MMYGDEYKLCYVDSRRAFFTTRDLDKQWGDDWDDAPYEHNAGWPYLYSEKVWNQETKTWGTNPEPLYSVVSVYFDADLETPSDRAGLNSTYSVQSINKKATPWLSSSPYSGGPYIHIWAGATYPEFVRMIQGINGTIYEPIEAVEMVSA